MMEFVCKIYYIGWGCGLRALHFNDEEHFVGFSGFCTHTHTHAHTVSPPMVTDVLHVLTVCLKLSASCHLRLSSLRRFSCSLRRGVEPDGQSHSCSLVAANDVPNVPTLFIVVKAPGCVCVVSHAQLRNGTHYGLRPLLNCM